MIVQAQVSLYPLRTREVGPIIEAFSEQLAAEGLTIEPGPMSTRLRGEADRVFGALSRAFQRVAGDADVVLTSSVSNACPEETS